MRGWPVVARRRGGRRSDEGRAAAAKSTPPHDGSPLRLRSFVGTRAWLSASSVVSQGVDTTAGGLYPAVKRDRAADKARTDELRGQGVCRAPQPRLVDRSRGGPARQRPPAAHLRRPGEPRRQGPGLEPAGQVVKYAATRRNCARAARLRPAPATRQPRARGRGNGRRAQPRLRGREGAGQPARVHRGAARPARDQRALRRAAGGHRGEILVFTKPPYATPSSRTSMASRSPGRTRRGASTSSRSSTRAGLEGVRRFVSAGEQARFVSDLPLKLVIIDESIVMFGMEDPIAGSSELTIVVVEHPHWPRSSRSRSIRCGRTASRSSRRTRSSSPAGHKRRHTETSRPRRSRHRKAPATRAGGSRAGPRSAGETGRPCPRSGRATRPRTRGRPPFWSAVRARGRWTAPRPRLVRRPRPVAAVRL